MTIEMQQKIKRLEADVEKLKAQVAALLEKNESKTLTLKGKAA